MFPSVEFQTPYYKMKFIFAKFSGSPVYRSEFDFKKSKAKMDMTYSYKEKNNELYVNRMDSDKKMTAVDFTQWIGYLKQFARIKNADKITLDTSERFAKVLEKKFGFKIMPPKSFMRLYSCELKLEN